VGVRRPRFFPGQVLTSDDLSALVDHVESEHRRHNLALHGAGVVRGLAVEVAAGMIVVSPGVAIDPEGRLLEITEATTVGTVGTDTTGAVVLFAEERPVEPVPTPGGPEHRATETTSVVALRPAGDPVEPRAIVLARLHCGAIAGTAAS
jgi:hypothetical protein